MQLVSIIIAKTHIEGLGVRIVHEVFRPFLFLFLFLFPIVFAEEVLPARVRAIWMRSDFFNSIVRRVVVVEVAHSQDLARLPTVRGVSAAAHNIDVPP